MKKTTKDTKKFKKPSKVRKIVTAMGNTVKLH